MLKKDAVKHFGSAYRLAKILDINQSAVSRWPRRIPELRAAQLERLSEGALKYEPSAYHGTAR